MEIITSKSEEILTTGGKMGTMCVDKILKTQEKVANSYPQAITVLSKFLPVGIVGWGGEGREKQ